MANVQVTPKVVRLILAFAVCFAAVASVVRARANTTQVSADETARAITLLQQGQTEEAIKALRGEVKRDKKSVHAWHHLGLAFEKQGDTGEARKAHKKAAELGETMLDNQLYLARTASDFSKLLKPISRELQEAGESARKYMDLDRKLSTSKRSDWVVRADGLIGFSDLANGESGNTIVFKSKDVDVKARILSKPEPSYTEDARKSQTTGSVVLTAILAANGRVVGIHPMKGLPDGLTARAIRAAREIKFVPAMKDGKPVSTFVQLEYNFNLY